ncbi:MAG: SNF2 helicase associated domain-containing protein, partial [Lentisphaeria bacterium]
MNPEDKEKELNDKLCELAGSSKYKTGKALYDDGAVLDIIRDSRGIDTRVANEMGRFEKVRITLKKNYFSSKCTCRSRGTAICEHSVAAFLQFYKEYPEAVPFPLASPSTSTKAIPLDDPEKANSAIEGQARPGNQAIQQITFKQLLSELNEVKGHVVLNYVGKGYPSGESRWNNCPFVIDLYFGDKVYSGSNIKRLVETGSAAAGMNFYHFAPQDQQIMRFFSQHGDLSGSQYILNAMDMGALFHCLIGFERFYANDTKINVNKQMAELVIQVSIKDNGVEVEPRLRVEGYGLIPTTDVETIVARSDFWLGYAGQYWWIPAISGATWLHSFLRGETALVSEEDYSRLREHCSAGLLPVTLIDREDSMDTVIETGEFTPVLSLDWSKGMLMARLEFSYQGIKISMNADKMIWNGMQYFVRDEVGEERIVNTLLEMGFMKVIERPDNFALKSLSKIGGFLDDKLPE